MREHFCFDVSKEITKNNGEFCKTIDFFGVFSL